MSDTERHENMCWAQGPHGYYCTRETGHGDWHVAKTKHGLAVETWSPRFDQPTDPPSAVPAERGAGFELPAVITGHALSVDTGQIGVVIYTCECGQYDRHVPIHRTTFSGAMHDILKDHHIHSLTSALDESRAALSAATEQTELTEEHLHDALESLAAATEQIKTLESLNILKVLEQDESAAITENLLLHDQLADAQGDTQRLDAIEKGTHGLCHRRSAVTGVSSWEVWWGRHGNFTHATSLRAAIDAARRAESQ